MSIETRHRTGSTRARWAVAAAVASAVATTFLPVSANAAALRVVQDPVTGELRGPTAVEAEAFAKAEAALRATNRGTAAARSTGPKEIVYADGTVETKLDEDSMMFAVVNEQADGSLRMDCLPASEAKKAIKGSHAKKVSNSRGVNAMNATHATNVANATNAMKAGHDHP